MNIYGYESIDSNIQPLWQVTLQFSLDEMKDFSNFVQHTVKLFEQYGEKAEYKHFNDFRKIRNNSKVSDIILSRVEK